MALFYNPKVSFMKNLLVATLCLLAFAGARAQTRALGTVIGNQTVIAIPDMPPGYAVTAQALIYYPDDYFQAKNANKRYPLFMFLHGAGEGSSQDISEVNRLGYKVTIFESSVVIPGSVG